MMIKTPNSVPSASSPSLRELLRAELAQAGSAAAGGSSPLNRDQMLALAKANARFEANAHRAVIGFGLQRNEVTWELEAGWCPQAHAYRMGMLVEVHGFAHPDGSVTPVSEDARVPAWAHSTGYRVASDVPTAAADPEKARSCLLTRKEAHELVDSAAKGGLDDLLALQRQWIGHGDHDAAEGAEGVEGMLHEYVDDCAAPRNDRTPRDDDPTELAATGSCW
jgi:hypothetical protein